MKDKIENYLAEMHLPEYFEQLFFFPFYLNAKIKRIVPEQGRCRAYSQSQQGCCLCRERCFRGGVMKPVERQQI